MLRGSVANFENMKHSQSRGAAATILFGIEMVHMSSSDELLGDDLCANKRDRCGLRLRLSSARMRSTPTIHTQTTFEGVMGGTEPLCRIPDYRHDTVVYVSDGSKR